MEDLYETALYYAGMANSLADAVARDEEGVFAESIDAIFAASDTVYTGLYEQYPFLDTPIRTPKRMLFSELMSITGFTGVYFPFTSETNLNINAPACLLPSTIAHELAHQKNIAAEQEANFPGGQGLPHLRECRLRLLRGAARLHPPRATPSMTPTGRCGKRCTGA